jgi:4-diphosphocytidyl-2-C-methyl-D-erythritol kinase
VTPATTAAAGALRLAAPAKLNLYLHVVGRRPDGYHLLDSLAVFAAVGDELRFAPASGLSLTLDGPFGQRLQADDDNLVLKAARALAARSGRKPGAAIHLTKRLPVASGIGGGSADAAATLHGLNRLWDLNLPESALAQIGLGLGADVPVCLAGVPSFFGGIGNEIASAGPLPRAHVVLVNPGAPLATAAVFQARAQAAAGAHYSQPARWTEAVPDALALAGLLAKRGNDLTAAAVGLLPAIADVLAALEQQLPCLLARLSGSGATCFGLFAERGEARAAAAAIAAAHPDWWVVATVLTATPPEISVIPAV